MMVVSQVASLRMSAANVMNDQNDVDDNTDDDDIDDNNNNTNDAINDNDDCDECCHSASLCSQICCMLLRNMHSVCNDHVDDCSSTSFSSA